ncbi:hypothetical protein EDC96DRAFT_522712 [Choanephora cucurbitarum]|nr:hypothetical protein EDC96DRAFT_522712 [Choanephora cucurbitarum]
MSSALTKSTFFAAIGRSTAAATARTRYVPAASLHLSSVLSREAGVVEKVKDTAEKINIETGKKLSEALGAAQDMTDTASHKAEELKHEASVKSEQMKGSASNLNKMAGEKLSEGIDSTEKMAQTASEKAEQLKNQASQKTEQIQNETSEKTILESMSDMMEKTKQAVGLGAKKADHKADEVKDEAKLNAKKASHAFDETKEKAKKLANEKKEKAKDYTESKKNKAADYIQKAEDKASEVAGAAKDRAPEFKQ